MFRLLGSFIAVAAIASSGCLDCKKGGNDLLCGAEGTPAPELTACTRDADCGAGQSCAVGHCASLCQPRAVMPQFFALIDSPQKPLEGLRSAMSDLGKARCAAPADLACTSDSQCL